MGLDMYARSFDPAKLVGDPNQQINLQFADPGEDTEEMAYWRKFNHLHGWMKRLYNAKGGTETFNCEKVRLMPEDIDKLEEDLKDPASRLPATAGFFFGSDEWQPGDEEDLREFIANAREQFAAGRGVFYDSWW